LFDFADIALCTCGRLLSWY